MDEELYAEFWMRNGNLHLTKYKTFLLLSQGNSASARSSRDSCGFEVKGKRKHIV
jgi:hypothetical protein